jgi:hypothetical protein
MLLDFCPICHDPLKEDQEQVLGTPCGHAFHQHCL